MRYSIEHYINNDIIPKYHRPVVINLPWVFMPPEIFIPQLINEYNRENISLYILPTIKSSFYAENNDDDWTTLRVLWTEKNGFVLTWIDLTDKDSIFTKIRLRWNFDSYGWDIKMWEMYVTFTYILRKTDQRLIQFSIEYLLRRNEPIDYLEIRPSIEDSEKPFYINSIKV